MRVQPHLPRSPLVAMAMSRSGLAFSACSAANSPAPPEPNIKISVLSCSMFMSKFFAASEHADKEDEGDDHRHRGSDRSKLFLAIPPSEVFNHQHAQAAKEMHREEKYQSAFGEFDQRLIAPAHEAVEPRFTIDGEAERQKMQRQEDGERQPGQPMHQGCDPQRAAAMFDLPADHISTKAAMARQPRSASAMPNKM